MIKIIRVANPEKIRSKKIRQNTADLQNILTIALDVSKNGDAALKKYEKKFAKNPKLLPKTLRVSKQAIKKAHTQITKDQLYAIKLVKKRLENTEKKTLLAVQKTIKAENCGVKIQRSLEALESVGCYVPVVCKISKLGNVYVKDCWQLVYRFFANLHFSYFLQELHLRFWIQDPLLDYI